VQLNENVYGGAKHLLLGNQRSIHLAYLHLVTLILPFILKRGKNLPNQINEITIKHWFIGLRYKKDFLTDIHSFIHSILHSWHLCHKECMYLFMCLRSLFPYTFSFLYSLHFTFAFAISYLYIHPSISLTFRLFKQWSQRNER